MKKKLKIGVLFGGKSAEHEVSLMSAKNIIEALDSKKYQVGKIKIQKSGELDFNSLKKYDVIFPVLHGPFGEDGTIQGLLKFLDIPFVGAGVLGSALSMDKEVTKKLLGEARIPTPKFLVLHKGHKISFKEAVKKLGKILFIKPANMGSSVGVHKVKTEKDFKSAMKDAFCYDSKILIEEAIVGREIECSVLGNDKPRASLPGEIISTNERGFYSYKAKYLDESGAILKIPAELPKALRKKVQIMAVETFKALNCEGMARVDFFLKKNGEVLVNEVNTIPGFTDISMYPKLWVKSGIPQTKLLDSLIALAIERFEKEKSLKTTL